MHADPSTLTEQNKNVKKHGIGITNIENKFKNKIATLFCYSQYSKLMLFRSGYGHRAWG